MVDFLSFPLRASRVGRFLTVGALTLLLAGLSTGCDPLNNPYPTQDGEGNTFFSAFIERPKHLDPAQSYTEDESVFTGQIYEAPLQYHYLKRPYTLIPATARGVPVPEYYDRAGRRLPADAPAEAVARSEYEIALQPGIHYAPHPAFARDAQGRPRYIPLDPALLRQVQGIPDFPETGTRELKADDYIYQIKRLAHPQVHSPIFSLMAEHIVGLRELGEQLVAAQAAARQGGLEAPSPWLDLDRYPLAGVRKVDDYTYRIVLNGKFPQFLYWLAMPFFAPIPREVDQFYQQPGMAEKNLTLDWWPVGTGPYQLTENNPNARMVLSRNPYYHGASYPCEGEAGDQAAGLLADCGKPLPFIDRAVFTREKESIPYWNKFLQGYYDASGIASESFDQTVRVAVGGEVALSDEMQARGIRLLTSIRTDIFYLGFNMDDSLLGGLGERATKLRQAISIALDQEEFIAIFLNGRGIPAMGPVPPGIFGFEPGRAGINPVVYDWDGKTGEARRKSVEEAKRLLVAAGYANGRDQRTGEALVVNLDTTANGMGDKARLDWLVRQFAKLDIQLVIRSTDYNRFQDKIRRGAVQMFFLGWNADYPDPENFFFLLHGKEAVSVSGGENKANYRNPEFDRLFQRMRVMENTGREGQERLALIRRMNALVQHDAPWVFGFHPKSYTLGHHWLYNRKPNDVSRGILKYQRIDSAERAARRAEWNRPLLWPLGAFLALLALGLGWATLAYRRPVGKRGVS